jgi:hypothetical protein
VDLVGVAFLLGPVGGPVLALAAFVPLVTIRRSRPAVAAAIVLMSVYAAAFVTYWYFWGLAFDAVDAYRPVPAGVAWWENVSLVVCALAGLSLVLLWAATPRCGRRRRNTLPAG